MIAKNKYAQLALDFCSSQMTVMIVICLSATVLTLWDKCVLPYSKTSNALCNICIYYIHAAYATGRAAKVGGTKIRMEWLQRNKLGVKRLCKHFCKVDYG